MAAGLIKYDVVTISVTMADIVIRAKLARIINWEELGVPKFLIHPRNLGTSLRTQVYGIAYNRKLVPDKVAQTFTWETCTDPKWRGKTATDDRPQHLRVFYQDNAWGRKKTLDYAKRWSANKPSVESSRSTAAQKLVVGAYHFICGQTRKHIRELNEFVGVKSVGIVYPEPVLSAVGISSMYHARPSILMRLFSSSPGPQPWRRKEFWTRSTSPVIPPLKATRFRRPSKGKRLFTET